jgi:hypothetical protein
MASRDYPISNFKINKGTYQAIYDNLASIDENELILVTDKNTPTPQIADNGKAILVNASGEYELGNVQPPLVSGTNIKTINNTSILGSGDIDTKELPASLGTAGQVLKVNSGATGVEWGNETSELPSITGNASKVLKVNAGGTAVEWATDLNTDTRRAVKVNGVEKLAASSTTPLDLTAGTNITLSESSGVVTINSALTAGSNISISSNVIAVSSGAATSGKVLTADGSGGASWESASSVQFVDWS